MRPIRRRWAVFYPLAVATLLSAIVPSTAFLGNPSSSFHGTRLHFSSTSMLTNTTSIGFIGFGTIAHAIAKGLTREDGHCHSNNRKIALSQRSTDKSQAFAQSCPSATVMERNQDIVDASDVLFLTVLPKQTTQVLSELKLDPNRHTLISLVSTHTVAQLQHDCRLPPTNIYKLICLPVVAYGKGVCLLLHGTNERDHDASMEQFLAPLGTTVWANDEGHLSAMMVVSGLMGGFYGILRQHRDWLVTQTSMTPAEATTLVLKSYSGMLWDALERCNNGGQHDVVLEELIDEQTAGGLNEQALNNLEQLNVIEGYDRVLDALFARLSGESDGSL